MFEVSSLGTNQWVHFEWLANFTKSNVEIWTLTKAFLEIFNKGQILSVPIEQNVSILMIKI